MIILILLGLIQALILPGLIFTYHVKTLDFRDRIIFSSALSLTLNYIIVWILYALHSYSQYSIYALIIIELFILFKFKSLIFQDLFYFYNLISQQFISIIKTKSIDLFSFLLVVFCIYYFYLLKLNGFLTVFTHWDAVVSWNRWAIEIHDGTFQGSRGYPLAIPILFSLISTITNEVNIQTFVKYICIYWPFLGGLVIFRCGCFFPKLKNLFGVAAILYLYLLSKGSWTSDFIFSGLVDPFMAAFGAIFIYCVLIIYSSDLINTNQFRCIFTLSAFSIAGSALVKLTGLFLLFYFLLLIFIYLLKNNLLKHHIKYYFFLSSISIILSIHWYVFTTTYWHDWQLISEYSSLQDPRIWVRPFKHFILFTQTFGWTIIFFIFLGIFSSKKIFISFLFLVPIFLFCSVTVGYDLRATFILFAPLAIFAALGFNGFFLLISEFNKKIISILFSYANNKKYILISFLFIIFSCSSFVLISFFSRDQILKSNYEKRIAANNFGNNGNQTLLNIFQSEPNARIISCWQTPWGLPGAPGKFIPSGNCTITLVEGWLADPSIKYWLYHDQGNASQPLTPEFVSNFLRNQPIQIQANRLGSGFVLYSKIYN